MLGLATVGRNRLTRSCTGRGPTFRLASSTSLSAEVEETTLSDSRPRLGEEVVHAPPTIFRAVQDPLCEARCSQQQLFSSRTMQSAIPRKQRELVRLFEEFSVLVELDQMLLVSRQDCPALRGGIHALPPPIPSFRRATGPVALV